jgi:hypothetical protein
MIMARKNNAHYSEWMEDLEPLPEIRNMKEKASKSSTKQNNTKKALPERDKSSQQLLEQIDAKGIFNSLIKLHITNMIGL